MPRFELELSNEETARKGEQIFESRIAPLVRDEDPQRFLAIDVVTGEYEVDESELAAMKRLKGRVPGAWIWLRRVGTCHARRLGARPISR